MNIIGLGNAGCKIADLFSVYEQYTVYKIATNLQQADKNINLPLCSSPEEYEEKCPDLSGIFSSIKDEVLFILAGGSDISGATLAVLEQLKHTKISVLYVKPDVALLSTKKQLQEKVVCSVLQEYARSGLFEKLYLVDNQAIEQFIGEMPLTSYFDKINEVIATTLHMILVYSHNEPLLFTDPEISAISRIRSFGIVDFKSGKENLFSNLENTTNKYYIYSIDKSVIQNDGKLISKIRNQIKEKQTQNTKCGFAIHQNEYSQNYIYVESCTHIVQNSNLTLDK